MLQKLIQHASIFYLLLRSLKTSILPIFSKELFNSSIFSRKETLIINSKKMKIIKAGNKVMKERLLDIKNR